MNAGHPNLILALADPLPLHQPINLPFAAGAKAWYVRERKHFVMSEAEQNTLARADDQREAPFSQRYVQD